MALSEDFASSYISVGLNNIIARETRVEPQPLSIADSQSLVDSLTFRRFRFYNPWPVLKKTVSQGSLIKGAGMTRKITEHNYNISFPFSTFQCSTSKLRSTLTKREIGFPRFARGIMSTIHHPRMDSPTIPGIFPLHEKSFGAPDEADTSSLSVSSKTALVSEPCILFPGRDEDLQAAAAAINDRLNPTARTKASPSLDVSQRPPRQSSIDNEEKPPVPPKSPSLTLRLATGQHARLVASKYNLSSSKISLKLDTNVNTNNTGHITNQKRHSGNHSRASTVLGIFPPVPKTSQSHQRSESAYSHFSSTKPSLNRKPVAREVQVTGSPIINRGRPNKRRNNKLGAPLKQPTAVEQGSFAPLPSGFDVVDAKEHFPSSEVDILQHQARNQAQRFKVLKYSDVRLLSLELRVFDERYEYLRHTHKTLRLGRSHLHERMIAFLRSPRSTTNFRDIMLRQEKALAELDHTIDEWYIKLEQVENRRSRVRQKLLEHIAGSLMMTASSSSSSSSSPSSQLQQQTTPPQSPTIPDAEIARESIKIYAESGVYADADIEDLLAEIERQMEEMNSSREQSPCTDNSIAAWATF